MASGGQDVASTRSMTSRPVYTKFARHYDILFGALDAACLDFVQATVPPPAAVLDAGCGTGHYAAALASRGYTVIAADREPDLIDARTVSSAGVDFVLADLRELPFVARFDVILARGVLNDLVEPGDLSQALRSLAAALSRDGRFIADAREQDAHRRRVANQPVVEWSAGRIAFRVSRSMDDGRTIISREQFARNGNWTDPFEFRMRTFTEEEVHGLWREADLEVVSIQGSYGPGSRLTDRLVVVARRASAREDRGASASE